MQEHLDTNSIEAIIDKVAANPAKAGEVKRALRKLVTAKEPGRSFEHRPRRRVAEIDDDLFDNMPV